MAARQPGMVKKNWIKPGAIVIDVGINSVPGELAYYNFRNPALTVSTYSALYVHVRVFHVSDASRKSGYRLVGDVDYASVTEVAGWLTPVPGGVGPMTVAMLMSNTLCCARKQLKVHLNNYRRKKKLAFREALDKICTQKFRPCMPTSRKSTPNFRNSMPYELVGKLSCNR